MQNQTLLLTLTKRFILLNNQQTYSVYFEIPQRHIASFVETLKYVFWNIDRHIGPLFYNEYLR